MKTALIQTIKKITNHPQFAEWFSPLEEQLLAWNEKSKFLWWMADVSNGKRQALTPAKTEVI